MANVETMNGCGVRENLFGTRADDAQTEAYDEDIHARLLRRYNFKRELLILTIENFIVDNDDRRVLKLVADETTEPNAKTEQNNGENSCTLGAAGQVDPRNDQRRRLISMLKLRRAEREQRQRQQQRDGADDNDETNAREYESVSEHVRRMSNEQLNETLHILDDLYKDVIDMIEFGENVGLALMSDNDDTVNLFIEILGVLLAR